MVLRLVKILPNIYIPSYPKATINLKVRKDTLYDPRIITAPMNQNQALLPLKGSNESGNLSIPSFKEVYCHGKRVDRNQPANFQDLFNQDDVYLNQYSGCSSPDDNDINPKGSGHTLSTLHLDVSKDSSSSLSSNESIETGNRSYCENLEKPY